MVAIRLSLYIYMRNRLLMSVKKTLLLLFLSITVQLGAAQSLLEQFNTAFSKKDTAAQAAVLAKWEAGDPGDPELYVCYFNYYVKKSMASGLSIDRRQKGKESLVITDPADSNTVGYINEAVFYTDEYLKKGFEWIDKGIAKFPDRLDMRFGKVYMLGQKENYNAFTTEIVNTIEYSNVNKNKWRWKDNKPLDEPQKFMLGAVQDYVVQLYEVSDEQAGNIQKMSEAVLKCYPDHVESLSNLAISHMLRKDFDGALVPLLKAEKISPKDFIVLSNIAWCYYQENDKKNAIKYYELTSKYGDEAAKQFAGEKLKELNKK